MEIVVWCGTMTFPVLGSQEHFISAQQEILARWLFLADTSSQFSVLPWGFDGILPCKQGFLKGGCQRVLIMGFMQVCLSLLVKIMHNYKLSAMHNFY